MDPTPVEKVKQRLHATLSRWDADTSHADMRRQWDALFAVRHHFASTDRARVPNVDATWIAAPGVRDDRVLLYLHGGGYVMGSVRSHWNLIARLSSTCNCRALGVDYRLAPEHTYPAAIEDVVAAYRWLLGQGIPASGIVIAGDSAGGGLAMMTLLALRDSGVPLPALAVLMSPWVDFEATGESFTSRKNVDPMVRRRLILETARLYLSGKISTRDPKATPLFADLAGFPPLLVQVGDHETLLDDSRSLCARAQKAGVDTTLEIWPDMFHVFQLFADEIDDARRAVDAIGAFVRRHLR
ncbi:MAG: alpha/beta hydrolase [Dehalococcoidia bacterium]